MTVRTVTSEEAVRTGTATPLDRPAALAVAHSQQATVIDIAPETELAEPLVIQLTGEDAERVVWGHLVLRVGPYAKATVVFEHTGAARYASSLSVHVGESAQLDLVSLSCGTTPRFTRGRSAPGSPATPNCALPGQPGR